MNDWDLGFDLDKLQAFHAVVRLGGVGLAARALHRSQPAVSHRLRMLSEGLGVALFERLGRRLALTAAGKELAARCDELFALTRDLRTAATAPDDRTVRGVVRVGTYATVASHLLAPELTRLLATHPELGLRFAFALAGPLIERLRSGELDVVLVGGTALRALGGITVERLGSDPMIAVAAPGLVPPRVRRIPALRALRHLAWEGDDETFGQVRDVIQRLGLSAGAGSVVIPHLESLRRLALAGAGWTVLPRYVVADDLARGALVDLCLAGLDVTLDFHVLRRTRAVMTPAIAAVLEVLGKLPVRSRE